MVEASQVTTEECEFQRELVLRLLKKLDYGALLVAASAVEKDCDLPPEKSDDDDFLRKVHHFLFEVHVVEGALLCPDTRRRYPIANGIPNMLLHEDELGGD